MPFICFAVMRVKKKIYNILLKMHNTHTEAKQLNQIKEVSTMTNETKAKIAAAMAEFKKKEDAAIKAVQEFRACTSAKAALRFIEVKRTHRVVSNASVSRAFNPMTHESGVETRQTKHRIYL